MKPMKRIVFLVLLALIFTGCAQQITNNMKKWSWKHVSALVAYWGPPTQIMEDGQGGQVYIYRRDRGWVMPGYSTTTTNVSGGVYGNQVSGTATSYSTYSPAVVNSWTAYRIFWISKTGYIYNWSWKGI